MAKYSTGGAASGGGGGSCELCGATADDLRLASVAGAELQVCPDCAPHDESRRHASGGDGDDGNRDETERRRNAAQNAAALAESGVDPSERWEREGAGYDDDQLPYLVADYGDRLEAARQEAGLQRDELATQLDVEENDLLAVEQGRATQAGVGGSVIRALEDLLDVSLTED
ncbi:MAG: multiprotein-bridging factor 1 family protein [Halobacteriaceae archaeon]